MGRVVLAEEMRSLGDVTVSPEPIKRCLVAVLNCPHKRRPEATPKALAFPRQAP